MKRTLEWEVLDIIEDAESMSQHARRVYWTDEIIRLVRADERQRIVWLIGTFAHGALGDCDCQLCVTLYRLSVAIKGDSDA